MSHDDEGSSEGGILEENHVVCEVWRLYVLLFVSKFCRLQIGNYDTFCCLSKFVGYVVWFVGYDVVWFVVFVIEKSIVAPM